MLTPVLVFLVLVSLVPKNKCFELFLNVPFWILVFLAEVELTTDDI